MHASTIRIAPSLLFCWSVLYRSDRTQIFEVSNLVRIYHSADSSPLDTWKSQLFIHGFNTRTQVTELCMLICGTLLSDHSQLLLLSPITRHHFLAWNFQASRGAYSPIHHILSWPFHAYYGCHHRHVVTVLALPAPCTIISGPCLLWLPPTTCSHHTTFVDTKDRGILCGGRAVPGGARYWHSQAPLTGVDSCY